MGKDVMAHPMRVVCSLSKEEISTLRSRSDLKCIEENREVLDAIAYAHTQIKSKSKPVTQTPVQDPTTHTPRPPYFEYPCPLSCLLIISRPCCCPRPRFRARCALRVSLAPRAPPADGRTGMQIRRHGGLVAAPTGMVRFGELSFCVCVSGDRQSTRLPSIQSLPASIPPSQ